MADPRPIIGVNAEFVPSGKTTVAQFRLNAGYVDLILAAGGLPVVLPPIEPLQNNPLAEVERYVDRVDGVLLTGGADIDPRQYGAPTHPAITRMAKRREEHDRRLFQVIHKRRVPVLGVGLGMQQINVALGGTLYPHLPESLPRAMPHLDETGEPHRHLVLLEPNTHLNEIYGDGELRVNSEHHQAIAELGTGLRVGAKAPDGVIEAIELIDSSWFCIGVQWHPESETASALDLQLIDCFLQSCLRTTQPVLMAA